MDPDTAYHDLQDAMRGLCIAETDKAFTIAAAQMQESFEALDGWLSQGGYLPRKWAKASGVSA